VSVTEFSSDRRFSIFVGESDEACDWLNYQVAKSLFSVPGFWANVEGNFPVTEKGVYGVGEVSKCAHGTLVLCTFARLAPTMSDSFCMARLGYCSTLTTRRGGA